MRTNDEWIKEVRNVRGVENKCVEFGMTESELTKSVDNMEKGIYRSPWATGIFIAAESKKCGVRKDKRGNEPCRVLGVEEV